MAKGNLAEAGCAKCMAMKQGRFFALTYNSAADREVPPVSRYARNMTLLKQEIASGASVLRSKPTVISYTPSHKCNYRCIHCYQNSNRDSEISRKEAVHEVLALLPYLSRLVAGGGEPFILPIWRDVLQNADISINPYLEFATSTNASVVTDEILAGLRRFSSIRINVSFDGATKEIYEAVRINGKFERVVENIDKLIVLTSEKGQPSRLAVSMSVMKANVNNIPHMVEFAAQKRIDFNLSPVVTMPVDQILTCFNNPLLETEGWRDAISTGRAIFEELFRERLKGLDEASRQVYRNAFLMVEGSIPWDILRSKHHLIKNHVPERLIQLYVKQYGKDIVICFFPCNEDQPQECRYYSFLSDGSYEVHLPEGKYLVGLNPRHAAPAPPQDWMISVKSNNDGVVKFSERLPHYYKVVSRIILRKVYGKIINTIGKSRV